MSHAVVRWVQNGSFVVKSYRLQFLLRLSDYGEGFHSTFCVDFLETVEACKLVCGDKAPT
jgi:hypothetical protein